jgi:hypothetical protein
MGIAPWVTHRQPVNTADEVSMMKIRRTDIQKQ